MANAAKAILHELDPYSLAAYYSNTDENQALQIAYSKQMAFTPDRKWFLNLIGLILSGQGKYGASIPYFEASIEDAKGEGEDFPLPEINESVALFKMGNKSAAARHFGKYGGKAADAGILNTLGTAYASIDRHVEAIDYYKRAIEKGASSHLLDRFYYNLALGYLFLADPDGPDENPFPSPNGNANVAFLDLKAEILDSAAAAIQSAIRLDSKEPDYFTVLGMIQNARQKYEEARPALKEAAEITPKLPEFGDALSQIYYHLAVANSEVGSDGETAMSFCEAVHRDPDYAASQSDFAREALRAGRTTDFLLLMLLHFQKPQPSSSCELGSGLPVIVPLVSVGQVFRQAIMRPLERLDWVLLSAQ